MNIKKIFISLFMLQLIYVANAQDVVVEVKGVGPDRASALNDARRMAVEKGCGVAVKSNTEVRDFLVIRDAISTQSTGWISWDSIVKETPLRDTYEVILKAKVSQKVIEQNMKTLAQWLGGLQFLVFYDPREVPSENLTYYNYACDRFDQQLKARDYRYIERRNYKVFTQTGEIEKLANDTSEYSYMQRLGNEIKAEFTIFIDKIDIRNLAAEGFAPGYKVTIHAIAYDNCTAEGFAPVVMEGTSAIPDKNTGIQTAIDQAILKGSETMLYQFNKYMGDWVSTGAAFELRFYGIDYDELRPLKSKFKNDPLFGQQLSINDEATYSKWNMTFNSKPDELLDFVLDNA